jgi:hypothetical protein
VQKTKIIESFYQLGQALLDIPQEIKDKAQIMNPWFTQTFIQLSANNWSNALSKANLESWLKNENSQMQDKTLGIIMAGNIPLVGLHDLLSGLAKGLKIAIKLSSSDEVLMKYAIEKLIEFYPELEERINTEGKLNGIQYLIATGSNNSARYFEYYFKNVPAVIRKNRTSIAVLNGNENEESLKLLADDIYSYYGLGCRNVSHLILPRGFELRPLYEAYDVYMDHVNHHKYYNNYMYHKSILLMNLDKHYDNGFMLFQEKQEPHAPIATLNYHYYDHIDEVHSYLEQHKEQWQCVASDIKELTQAIGLGQTQKPGLLDYADNINVLDFLS